jgi:hypothetical protein
MRQFCPAELLLLYCCRPYGVASLLAVHDKEAGPQLYLVEPSGVLLVGACAGGIGGQCWGFSSLWDGGGGGGGGALVVYLLFGVEGRARAGGFGSPEGFSISGVVCVGADGRRAGVVEGVRGFCKLHAPVLHITSRHSIEARVGCLPHAWQTCHNVRYSTSECEGQQRVTCIPPPTQVVLFSCHVVY